MWSKLLQKFGSKLVLVPNENLGELWLNLWIMCKKSKKRNMRLGSFSFDSFLLVLSVWW